MKGDYNSDGYATVRIPKALADEIDEIVRSGILGYRTRAELVKDAIRLRIALLPYNNLTKSNSIELKQKK